MKFEYKFAALIIALLVFLFFSNLFYPEPKMFYTPDFGRSDIWHLNYPIKDFLAESLKKGKLPFWSKDIGTGFPIYAEGQVGSLFIPNLLLFLLFPTWLAWNLSFLSIFFISILGSFLLFRKNGTSFYASLFASIAFGFGGFFIVHIPHFNLVQAAALLPWVIIMASNFWNNSTKFNFLITSFLFAQLIFIGHAQMTFIILIAVLIFFVAKHLSETPDIFLKKAILTLLSVVFSLFLAAPQLVPTLEFLPASIRGSGISLKETARFPFKLKHLSGFINPNYIGDPTIGDYPHFSQNDGIYWENIGYVGVIPLLLSAVAIFKKKKSRWEKYLVYLLIASFVLVLGVGTPFLFIFAFPGFSLFRVPSRFLILVALSLSGLSAVGFDLMRKYLLKIRSMKAFLNIFMSLLIIILFLNLYLYSVSYNPLVKVNQALSVPEVAKFIPKNSRIFTVHSQYGEWNKFLLEGGWKDISPYLYFKNGLNANLNLLFDISHFEAVSGAPLIRNNLMLNQVSLPILNTGAVDYIISPGKLVSNKNLIFKEVVVPLNKTLPNYYIYKNNGAYSRFRFVSNYEVIKGDLENKSFLLKNFPLEKKVILENEINESFENLEESEIKVVKDTDTEILLKTKSDKKAILVISDSYYRGWRAKIDGKDAKILPANINQRALIVPAGENEIRLYYQPTSFYLGVFIALLSILAFFYFVLRKSKGSIPSF